MGRIRNVLVVDDSDEVRDFLTILLEDAGYAVEQASDGVEAFELVRRQRPDLIVLDMVMPRMDGLDLLVKLRSDLAPPIPPTILCSGFDLTEEEALRRGALRFLHKPVSPAELLQAVAAVDSGLRPSSRVMALEKARVTAARQRALQDASELMEQVSRNEGAQAPRLQWLAEHQVEGLAHYLGVAGGVTALVKDERLTVVASTGEHPLAPGTDLATAMPPAYQVLETGSALVLADASAHPSFHDVADALGGIRFFMGVPVRGPSGLPVGVICLFDHRRREVEAEDLSVLQQFGRTGSAVLAALARGEGATISRRHGAGVWTRPVFEHVLDCELQLLTRHGGSMTLAALITSDVDEVRAGMWRAPSRERLMCCLAYETQVLLCKRSLDRRAGPAMAALLAELRMPLELLSVGRVDLAGHGPKLFGAGEIIRLAEVALEHAEGAGVGMVTLALVADEGELPRSAKALETH
jgi:CheY-like chemotaxis protein